MKISLMLMVVGIWYTGHAWAIEPRELLEVSDFSSPVVSPDGKQVAFRVERASIERNTYDAFWYVQDLDRDSLPRRIADGGVVLRDSAGTPLPATVVWSPDGRWIYYRALVDGKLEVWGAPTDGAGARSVTRDPADVREFALTDGGRVLKYSVGPTREAVLEAEQAEYDRGIRIDNAVPVGQGLFRSGNIEGRLATQRYGKIWFDRTSLLADVPDQWKAVDLSSGATQNLDADPVDEREDADQDKRYPDAWKVSRSLEGDRVAILTRFGEKNGLQLGPDVRLSASLPGKHVREMVCEASLCTGKAISSIQWRPYRDEVLFTVTDRDAGGTQSIYRWDVVSGAVRFVARSSGLLNGGRDSGSKCGASTAALVCVSAAANQPPRLEWIDVESGARRVLFAPNAALGQAMAASTPASLLRWTDAEGRVFSGQFYAAKVDPGIVPPLFVNYYLCSGFVRGGLGDEWPFASLAAHGISALCINSQPYRVEPVDRYDEALSAVESAVKLLSESGQIDAARVGMGGLSFGSEVTLWVAMRSRLLSAASISSPSVSSTYYLFGSLKGAKFWDGLKDLWGLESPKKSPGRWRLLSPEFNLDRISIPVLFQMPEQEYLPALDYAIELINTGRGDLYVFPNEPHQKFQPRHKLAVYERNLDWFRFWLQGFEDGDVAKANQYVGWRAMRERVARDQFSESSSRGPGG